MRKSKWLTYPDFNTAEACDDIPKTLEEGIERGKRYKDLLKKIEDPFYLDRWLLPTDNVSG